MARLRVLFIGGTGIISSACVRSALVAGYDVAVINRGTTSHRPVPSDVEILHADVRDSDVVEAAVSGRRFDVVADFMSFVPDHVESHVAR